MGLALIDQVSTWYTVDKDHPTAVEKSEELRKMYPRFQEAWRDLRDYVKVNDGLLTKNDLEAIPIDLEEQVTSKMRQLRAMGYEE